MLEPEDLTPSSKGPCNVNLGPCAQKLVPPMSPGHPPATTLGLTHHQEFCPAFHHIQFCAGHTAVVALVAILQAVDDQLPIIYDVPGGKGREGCLSLCSQWTHHFPPSVLCSFPSFSCQNLLPQSRGAPPTDKTKRYGHSAFPTLPPSTEPWLGLGPHLSLSPSSWSL